MARHFQIIGLSALAMGVTACARVEITRLPSEAAYMQGLRFYRPAPYLLRSMEKDVCTERIVYLPDKGEEYVIRVHSGYGAVDAKVALENGWNLTALGETRDSKIPETIAAVGGLVKAVEGKAGEKPEKPPECKPGLFKLNYQDGTWRLP